MKAKSQFYTTTIAIIFWKDAAIHGHRQQLKEDWEKEVGIMPGVATGHLVFESEEFISLGMDLFWDADNDIHFRTVSSYPKTGISQIIKKEIEIKGLKVKKGK